jgi:MoaA/NifB/PqqE/SkfB family radical SAM enzyme
MLNLSTPSTPTRRDDPDGLPTPVFPHHPKRLIDPPEFDETPHVPPARRHWTPPQVMRVMRGWLAPYLRSRLLPGDFHPIIAYLFTEYKCNLDCHYCWAYDNRVKGMTEATARRSIDWLRDHGTGVLALMGGEPLLRPNFVHKVVDYAASRGFFVYLPTNGRLLRPDVIDKLADAGLATVNLAVDSYDIKTSLPKALVPIRRQFDYLVKKQYRYGYTVFLNINICRNNLDDVRTLTEIAHDNGIATDYHINEMPLVEPDAHFTHRHNNETYIQPEDRPRVTELIDWLIDRRHAGYKMVESVQRLAEMKQFMTGHADRWHCRAGQNSLIVRVDGTLAPCFPMYSVTHNWGSVGDHRFEPEQLATMKETCERSCFSTLNSVLAFCYDDARVIRYFLKGASRAFQGMGDGLD